MLIPNDCRRRISVMHGLIENNDDLSLCGWETLFNFGTKTYVRGNAVASLEGVELDHDRIAEYFTKRYVFTDVEARENTVRRYTIAATPAIVDQIVKEAYIAEAFHQRDVHNAQLKYEEEKGLI